MCVFEDSINAFENEFSMRALRFFSVRESTRTQQMVEPMRSWGHHNRGIERHKLTQKHTLLTTHTHMVIKLCHRFILMDNGVWLTWTCVFNRCSLQDYISTQTCFSTLVRSFHRPPLISYQANDIFYPLTPPINITLKEHTQHWIWRQTWFGWYIHFFI